MVRLRHRKSPDRHGPYPNPLSVQRALAAVQASEQRIGAIVEAARDAFVGVDMRGLVTDWNSAAGSLTAVAP